MLSINPQKASVAEIFAAVSGVITEGANLSRQGVKINDHALVKLAGEGAMALWDAKYMGGKKPLNINDDQEHITQPLVRFLEKSLPVLADNTGVGKVALVYAHIQSILGRETATEDRAIERFKDGGAPASSFKAEYQSKAAVAEDPTVDVGVELDLEEEVAPAKTVARITSKRGRKPRGQSASPSYVPA